MALYLGLDSSTQSLTAMIVEVDGRRSRRVVFEHSLRFDETFPHYETRTGVLPREDLLVAHSSPLLWAEALDVMMGVVANDRSVDLGQLRAISGSGQQHGSVYVNTSMTDVLGRLDARQPLAEQVSTMFTRKSSPIWMDSSTQKECEEITRAVGSRARLAELTGSSAFERFTGPQIRKFFRQSAADYERTAKIHLVSSYLASLLAGKHAPIDPGDGAGMNLMDLARKQWAPLALEATAPDLYSKLPDIAESSTVVGMLSPFWVKRYGFPADVKVVAWSGDNPCSLVGVGLVKPGRMAISLGTSDTLFGFMEDPKVDPEGGGHAFGSPTGDYMSLICFKNGSLARERIRDELGLNWATFSEALRSTPVGNRGRILLPWFEPEITPPVHDPGVRRYGFEAADGAANVRAVIEAQMMSTFVHSQWMGSRMNTIYATGGAARNRDILRVMSDVHNAQVYQFEVGNSACLGAALRAFHADELARGNAMNWDDVVADFAEPVSESRIDPDPGHVAVYDELKDLYRACEDHALKSSQDPTERLAAFARKHV